MNQLMEGAEQNHQSPSHEFSVRSLRAAIGFLTVLPVLPNPYPDGILPRSAVFFPLVGAFIGAIGAGVLLLSGLLFSAGISVIAALLAPGRCRHG